MAGCTVKANCPVDGEVTLSMSDVRLVVFAPPVEERSFYAFTCPACQTRWQKPADNHVVSLLMSGGIRVEVCDVPAEALESHVGPQVGNDDLLDLWAALADLPDADAKPEEKAIRALRKRAG